MVVTSFLFWNRRPADLAALEDSRMNAVNQIE